ncbi:MAG: mreC [Verrucomicrobiales bacterium]|nr:mreC [Verrucomicrobiales bacterium]
MLRRPYYIAFTVVVLLTLVLLNLPGRTTAQIKLGLSGLFLPLFGLANSAHRIADRTGNSLVPKKYLLAEVERLHLENEQLKIAASQTTNVWLENAQLRQALGWQRQVPFKMKLANVIMRDPANWWRTIQIDLGSKDGVITNLPVRTSDGLVGRVEQVGYRSARVLLLGDPKCPVAAQVQETGAKGVLVAGPSSILDQSIVQLSYVPRNSLVRPGNRVITSGEGGYFPRGIPIGEVVDTNSVDFGLYVEARVKLTVNLRQLDSVWVVWP